MNNFKNKLISQLTVAVNKVCSAQLIIFEVTDEGFFCDYDMEQAIKPEILIKLTEYMKQQQIDAFFELSGFSGVYKNGDSSNKVLQRIYVTAFNNEKQFSVYKKKIDTAKEHSHQKINTKLSYYSSSDKIGQGLVMWHPKGAMLRYLVEGFSQKAHILNDYEWVYTPHIGKADLWRTSGHLDFYKDSMYSPINIDDEEYYLKPMSCPFHVEIYNSQLHSYKELPVRFAEYGTVYRYELSGALNGLTRVRGFTQDDAHIICREDQLEKELSKTLELSLYVLRAFGFEEFHAYVATMPKDKHIGDENQWAKASAVLENIVEAAGIEYDIDEGGGAFYGPKIDLKLKDSLNREWQCSTIQFDFNLPERFDMNYIGSDGKKHTPYMIHRELFGSIERFTALLIEQYKGDFPLWFAPIQFGIIPIKEKHNDYCRKLLKQFKLNGLRAKLNEDDSNMRNKIKSFKMEKVPYIIVIGDKEVEESLLSVSSKKSEKSESMSFNELLKSINADIEKGIPKPIFD